ncbi:probable non-specific lipid-transfer protein AKCS9 [Vigna umbellata]|uniref:probable non-specific lipid-transfer protein AKCS9 n=1 Tax=Vigna umbellata TaxID=87088 RepID=UPI001F5EDB6E|nr:probable non-specific lipid-transfer protein AKCS9 [Vigna umbellata]
MTMKKSVVSAVVLVALLLIDVGPLAQAACSPAELSPCLPAITSGSSPSGACCTKLKQQKPCLCGYLQNPSLKQYVNSPNAKKVLSACGVPYPKC